MTTVSLRMRQNIGLCGLPTFVTVRYNYAQIIQETGKDQICTNNKIQFVPYNVPLKPAIDTFG